jgi:hypothetical protein
MGGQSLLARALAGADRLVRDLELVRLLAAVAA